MLLSQLKETTSHGLKWNNSPTERLDRMLNKPDVRLITSQNTLRSLWLLMLSESWPLSSPMLLPTKPDWRKEG
ncbi:hypothetical protein RRG08_004326 [Elysia crispata]|uniref:Uncharacterized protein n=1 Tax=Elysia crispata TaxID=231223 RepID=A0AAE0YCI2_9GAST|nr:hypothetical protein RRG08_004326 [Elysia crispata]